MGIYKFSSAGSFKNAKVLHVSALASNAKYTPVTYVDANQVPWAAQGSVVTGQYFSSSTAFSLPQYPVSLSIQGTNPTWYNSTPSPSGNVLNSKFAIKMTASAMPNTSNNCASPSNLEVVVQDNTTGVISVHQIIGENGNQPQPVGGGCSHSWTGSPKTVAENNNGVAVNRTMWVKSNAAASIEVNIEGKLLINGVEKLSNVKAVAASIYAGYDGGNMSGTVDYVAKFGS